MLQTQTKYKTPKYKLAYTRYFFAVIGQKTHTPKFLTAKIQTLEK